MSFRFYRRSVALFTAMLFALSIAGHGLAVTNMGTKAMTAVATMDRSAADSSKAMDCDESDIAMQLVCHAFCASMVAVLSEPIELPTTTALQPANSFYTQTLPGQHRSPDPHPPRSIVLS